VTHRIVAAAVRLVLVAFVAGAFAFALVVRSRGGNDGSWPATHRNFGAGTCGTCHQR
jgi:cytochrome c553